jgi:hypothetical protein
LARFAGDGSAIETAILDAPVRHSDRVLLAGSSRSPGVCRCVEGGGASDARTR